MIEALTGSQIYLNGEDLRRILVEPMLNADGTKSSTEAGNEDTMTTMTATSFPRLRGDAAPAAEEEAPAGSASERADTQVVELGPAVEVEPQSCDHALCNLTIVSLVKFP